MKKGFGVVIVMVGILLLLSAVSYAGSIQRVSVDSNGNQGNGACQDGASISADGRYVAFGSYATNLVPGGTNGAQVFVHDRQTGITELISVDSTGIQGDNWSGYPKISADGRYVAFESWATNLVPGDTNGSNDIFVRDRVTGITGRASVDSNGNEANGDSYLASISADGRHVAFESVASNLVPGDTNGCSDIFVRDRTTGTTERVSIDSNGNQADSGSFWASINGDGRYVAFRSGATNLVAGDTNNSYDIFMRDRRTGTTQRMSVDSNGNQANGSSYWPSISGDGRYVAFQSNASNLVPGDTNNSQDIFVHDRITGKTERVSIDSNGNQANEGSSFALISDDGRYVAFESNASNLVLGDTNGWPGTDVFVHDRVKRTTERVSVDNNGNEGNGASHSRYSSISGDGRYVAFWSYADNLVLNDTNSVPDVFVYNRGP